VYVEIPKFVAQVIGCYQREIDALIAGSFDRFQITFRPKIFTLIF
jgi:hypothetical protein